MPIIKIDSTPSTNIYLKDLLNNSPLSEGTVVVADAQTAGRGQTGTHWESEPCKNLTFSLLLRPAFLPVADYFLLSKVVALGISDCLEKYLSGITIKWPNDIYWQDKKLVGILIENEITGSTIGQSVIGIGINVNQEIFRSDAPNPVSMKHILGEEIDLDILLAEMVDSILARYEALKEGNHKKIEQDYFSRLYRRQGYHWFEDKNGRFEAGIETVDNAGYIHLLTDTGERKKYAFKEVKYL